MRLSRRLAFRNIGVSVLGGTMFSIAGNAATTALRIAGKFSDYKISVEDYYRQSDAGDWLAAFQRAANAIHKLGCGTIQLRQPRYSLGQYSGSDVDGLVLSLGLDTDAISRILVLPSNVLVVAEKQCEIDLAGGHSSPFGYRTSINIMSGAFDGEENAEVSRVDQDDAKVYVSSTSKLRVGQTVRLARNGRPPAGTPSREDAPNQFLTIRSLDENAIGFNEAFRYRFDAVEDVVVRFRHDGRDYPRNVRLENIRFTTSGESAYICHSTTLDSGWRNVTLDRGVSASWGTSRGVQSDQVTVVSDAIKKNTLTIESVSDVEWGSLLLEGNESSNSLGGLLVDDASLNVHFRQIEARNFTRGGISLLYGVNVLIDNLLLRNCATSALAQGSFSAALSVGFPAVGAGPSSSLIESRSSKYSVRNTGLAHVHVRKMTILGPATVPVRAHDVDLVIDQAYIEFLDQGASAPFLIGQSGQSRADARFFPLGGATNITLGDVSVRTLGAGLPTLFAQNARGSQFSAKSAPEVSYGHLSIDGKSVGASAALGM